MNKYLLRVRNELLTFYQKCKKCQHEIKEYKSGKFNGWMDTASIEAGVKEWEQKINVAIDEYNASLDWIRKEYVDAVENWATLDGSKITDDAKLLNSGITLNEKDLKAIEGKYLNNYSMLRVIYEYAEKNELLNFVPRAIINPKEKVKELDYVLNIARQFSRSEGDLADYTATLWKSDEYFNNSFSKHGEKMEF